MSDLLARESAAYLAESFISLALAILLYYYYRIYKRQFLFIWSLSWLAALVSFMMLGILTSYWQQIGLGRHVLSFLATLAHSAELVLLILGSRAIVVKRIYPPRVLVGWALAVLAISVLVTFPYSSDVADDLQRYLLRIGYRYASTLLAFFAAGYIVIRQLRFTRTVGRSLVAASFFLFGLYQVQYLVIMYLYATGHSPSLPFFFGLVEIMLIGLIGLSMIVYLLEEEHTRLLDTNVELGNFLYRTSHDLRSPVATIMSIIMMARKFPADIAPEQYWDMVENRIKKVDQVISDIINMRLTVSRDVKPHPFSFTALVYEVMSELRTVRGAANINFKVSAPNDTLFFDELYLRDILRVVMGNSAAYMDHTKNDPTVSVTLTLTYHRMQIDVWDNGKGISEDTISRIFEMFYRGNVETDGTGLGLYLVSVMVKRLEGKISVTSRYGEWTRVTLVFPV